jgi:hypothetical protein
MKRLERMRDYFPTAIYTGRALVFISEDFRVELTEQPQGRVGKEALIRVRLFNKSADGLFVGGHYEDFDIEDISDLTGEIEKFVQSAVGRNLHEQGGSGS